jgi:hypothetical protein
VVHPGVSAAAAAGAGVQPGVLEGLGETSTVFPGERRIVVRRRPRSHPSPPIWALPASSPHDDRRHPGNEARCAKPS